MSDQLSPPFARKHRPARRVILRAILLLALSPLVYLVGAYGDWQFWGWPREIESRKRLILYKLNPAAVLATCRQIRANQAKFRGNPFWNPPLPIGSDMPDPADPLMPPIIRTIHPSGIIITPEGVHIELGGGFMHFGLAEAIAGAPPPPFAAKQLVPGLWYYAEDGRIPPP